MHTSSVLFLKPNTNNLRDRDAAGGRVLGFAVRRHRRPDRPALSAAREDKEDNEAVGIGVGVGSAAVGYEVRMISGEAPIVFSKACELFVEELTRRAWAVTVRGKRRTLHKDDVAAAVAATDIFDFLVELVSESNGNGSGGTGQVLS
uniref:Transcription factor CBF/NF-Y/archaeal histone domain-containing protein n=1 Tax=Ananas comosus var. bracteatus TaxID=296719 RepID=A0A6V7PJB8_ANACO|nr:unnamed protein product [Ananas comosus var. bracteatus]